MRPDANFRDNFRSLNAHFRVSDYERDTYPTQINIVLNWSEELKRLVAKKN